VRVRVRFLSPMPPDASVTPRYGDHLSKEEVDELIAPSSTTVESLEAWLAYHDIDPVSSLSRTDAGEWVTVTVPIGKVEDMLDAKYSVYKHVDTGETIVRTTSYSLPGALHEHVSVIAPTTYFGTMRAMKSQIFKGPFNDQVPAPVATPPGVEAPTCAAAITPECLVMMYNATGYVPTAKDKNVLGVAGYLDQFANYADLQVCIRIFLFSSSLTSSRLCPHVDLPEGVPPGGCGI